MKYAALHVRKIIMHGIVNKMVANGKPILSDLPAPMTDEQRLFIQERMRATLARGARPIAEDGADLPTPKLVRDYLLNGKDLPALSQGLAVTLQKVQPNVSPAGILLVSEADLDGHRALLVAKLELERGVRAPQATLPDGRVTYTIELLKDLLITTASKVYKVALFPAEDVSQNVLYGFIVDKQMAGHSIAQYFLTDFLGCRLAERADLFTERFHDASQEWVNKLGDPEKRARYEISLLSELQRNSQELSVNDFARDYLDEDDRDDFVGRMQAASVPLRDFTKDTALIKAKIARMKLDTREGVTVLAPTSTVEDGVVDIHDNADGTSRITIVDKVLKISGASGPPSRERPVRAVAAGSDE